MLVVTSTKTKKVTLLPVTGHCTCQTGAAKNTATARNS